MQLYCLLNNYEVSFVAVKQIIFFLAFNDALLNCK